MKGESSNLAHGWIGSVRVQAGNVQLLPSGHTQGFLRKTRAELLVVHLVIHFVWKKCPGVITYIGSWAQWMVWLAGQGLGTERGKDWGQGGLRKRPVGGLRGMA